MSASLRRNVWIEAGYLIRLEELVNYIRGLRRPNHGLVFGRKDDARGGGLTNYVFIESELFQWFLGGVLIEKEHVRAEWFGRRKNDIEIYPFSMRLKQYKHKRLTGVTRWSKTMLKS